MLKMKTKMEEREPPMEPEPAGGGSDGVAGNITVSDKPRDARVVRELLRLMGKGEYKLRIMHQFLELCYRYVIDVLSDAQMYTDHIGKTSIDPDDFRLAIQSKINFSFSQSPTSRGKNPYPKIWFY